MGICYFTTLHVDYMTKDGPYTHTTYTYLHSTVYGISFPGLNVSVLNHYERFSLFFYE